MTAMTSETRYGLVHLVRVQHDDRTRSLGYRPECLCGWAGTYTDLAGDAEVAAISHRDEAPGLPDGLDATMSALLDLQDGLAQAVVWLAENWEADLPVPRVCATTIYAGADDREGAAGVRLLAYCPDGASLARAAARLGAPLRDDEAPNTSGNRYTRAVRLFGRVKFEAYTEIAETAP